MQTLEKTSLFTELTEEEASTVSGAHHRYYSPCYYYTYVPRYSYTPSSYGYGGSSGGTITQTANVNVFIAGDDNQDIRVNNSSR